MLLWFTCFWLQIFEVDSAESTKTPSHYLFGQVGLKLSRNFHFIESNILDSDFFWLQYFGFFGQMNFSPFSKYKFLEGPTTRNTDIGTSESNNFWI